MTATLRPVLNHIHCARIRCAAQVAVKGRQVTLRVDGDGDSAFLVWLDPLRHVIASGSYAGMRATLPLAEMELEKQLNELRKESGAAV